MRWMVAMLLAVGGVLSLGGCNSYNLRYEARPQPFGVEIYVDYHLLQDAVGISVDTFGKRLEDIYVKKADGTFVRPLNITYPGAGGLTSVTFSQAAAGPLPWEVHVKVQGAEEAVVPGVGGQPTAK